MGVRDVPAVDTGRALQVLSQAAERYIFCQLDLPAPQLKKYLGRGQPAVPRRRPELT